MGIINMWEEGDEDEIVSEPFASTVDGLRVDVTFHGAPVSPWRVSWSVYDGDGGLIFEGSTRAMWPRQVAASAAKHAIGRELRSRGLIGGDQ